MNAPVVVVLVDDKIVGIGGPGFVVGGVSIPYAGDAVGLGLCDVVVGAPVVVVLVDDKIVGIEGPGLVVAVLMA